mmetsp:Transcript_4840/g.12086  ORF Transcript_4840/g.12086 Transcript_4840/m.12086 type:complete len:232 (+) Transcript_4840:691-1386(+)
MPDMRHTPPVVTAARSSEPRRGTPNTSRMPGCCSSRRSVAAYTCSALTTDRCRMYHPPMTTSETLRPNVVSSVTVSVSVTVEAATIIPRHIPVAATPPATAVMGVPRRAANAWTRMPAVRTCVSGLSEVAPDAMDAAARGPRMRASAAYARSRAACSSRVGTRFMASTCCAAACLSSCTREVIHASPCRPAVVDGSDNDALDENDTKPLALGMLTPPLLPLLPPPPMFVGR